MKLRYNLDLIVVAAVSLLLIPAVLFTQSLPARIAMGVPFLLFAPGYALVSAFFPARTSLSSIERVSYSVGLSIVLMMLTGLLLNYVWAIDLHPMLIFLESLTFILLCIAWGRRRNLMDEERIAFSWCFSWSAMPRADKVLLVLLAIVLVGAAGVAAYTTIKNTEPYSEFYLLGTGGKAADYPQKLAAGQEGQLTLVLTNHEKQNISYIIRISQEDGHTLVDGNEQSETRLTLANGQKQSYAVSFSFDAAGTGKKLEFDLYKGGSTEIYLSTYLRVDVS